LDRSRRRPGTSRRGGGKPSKISGMPGQTLFRSQRRGGEIKRPLRTPGVIKDAQSCWLVEVSDKEPICRGKIPESSSLKEQKREFCPSINWLLTKRQTKGRGPSLIEVTERGVAVQRAG